MLTDAAALALALVAARLVSRPARGSMTFGLGRAEILSAQANGITLLVLALLIVYGAIQAPDHAAGCSWLARVGRGAGRGRGEPRDRADPRRPRTRSRPGGDHSHNADHDHDADHDHGHARSLNVEGSYRHILTDLFGFIATAIAAAVIIVTGFTAPTRSPHC